MLVPAGVRVLAPEGWGVIISFSEDGYVKDDAAAKIDYGELLASMQKATREANPERAKAGYAQVELVGWAEPPSYDSVAHKLYWAKDLKFTDDSAHTLNYKCPRLGPARCPRAQCRGIDGSARVRPAGHGEGDWLRRVQRGSSLRRLHPRHG
jgi:hypothetical protein